MKLKPELMGDLARELLGHELLDRLHKYAEERDKLLKVLNKDRGVGQSLKSLPRKQMIALIEKHGLKDALISLSESEENS